jgi:GTP-sensing pleiotropic transcriptional regulator CodY
VKDSAAQARDAIRAAVDSGGGDLIGSADRLLSATAQIETEPLVPEEAKAVERLDEIEQELEGRKAALDAASQDLERAREGFETRGSTLTKFLDDLTNVSAEVEFQKQAERYEKESRRFWIAGLVTLVGAACVALLPLILNYVNHRHHALDGQNSVSAHLGVALAFAAVSGVLLARARNRDRNRQRNRDLSVALITMFAYSEQIANEQEKERFKHDMGRLVLEAFLRQEPPSEDRSNVLNDVTARAIPVNQPQES